MSGEGTIAVSQSGALRLLSIQSDLSRQKANSQSLTAAFCAVQMPDG